MMCILCAFDVHFKCFFIRSYMQLMYMVYTCCMHIVRNKGLEIFY